MNGLLFSLLVCLILFPIGTYFIQKHNLNYYKINGRQSIEIEHWLKTRKWYNSFKFNIQQEILNCHKNDNDEIIVNDTIRKEIDYTVNALISGINDKSTISSAFCWEDTLEGTEYWGKREKEFLMWYFGQYIDLHLFK